MRPLLLAFLALFFQLTADAQTSRIKNKKYPSLLWEISGNGLKKPSYLFGTMHVSSKIAFNLSDSFYIAIKNADVVALETNPGDWQEDFSRYNLDYNPYMYGYGSRSRNGYNMPSDYLTISSLKFYPYEKMMEAALSTNPSMINNFLYRNNSERSSDFEEDTYLDLYIYQVGRKWNKKLAGVEDFDESMNLVKEAYADAAKDKNSRERNYDVDKEFSFMKLEEAYRTGNLDLIDTIQKLNSSSAAFDEKFMYKRNEIQARNIDSILKTKAALFVGVGAAHLPGHRGVIEMLRQMGYKLRPIRMTERDSRHKEAIEQIRVPVTFNTVQSDDGFFNVAIPGKFYNFSSNEFPLNQVQYADMSNGSYYMVTRLQTNAALWGHSMNDVVRKVDSLLYENIPGKMLQKLRITRNGYPGFDIINRTRRGDVQRYNIFITPDEVLIFKMSGNGDYVKLGKESTQFFSSIQLKENTTGWKKFSPPFGGFEVDMPSEPLMSKSDNWYFMSYDRSNSTSYQVIRTDIHNTKFAEEDSFDLNLMEESFASSEFIDKSLSHTHSVIKGYSVLDVKYRYKSGSVALVRFMIQGPHYYTIVASAPKEHARMGQFLNSFSLKPFNYPEAKLHSDTAFYFTVKSPVAPVKQKKMEMYPENMFRSGSGDDDSHLEEFGNFRDKIISSDSTGEKIYVSLYQPGRYYYNDDTTATTDTLVYKTRDQDWVYRNRKKYELPNKTKVLEYELGDPLSSRVMRGKSFSRNGIYHRVVVMGDTTTAPSAFVQQFLESFSPVDTLKGVDPLEKKSALFFSDFYSRDTTSRKRAIKNIGIVKLDTTDFQALKGAITSLNWSEKKYLDIKNQFIKKLADMPSREAAHYLRDIYYAAGDTVEVQYNALEALLDHQTAYSYKVFRDIMLNEPPVLTSASSRRSGYDYGYRNSFLDKLTDTVQLTATIFRDLMPLITINDYEKPMMDLLETLVDSSLVQAADYELYLPKLLLETKQEMKKQIIAEKTRLIDQAQKDPGEKEESWYGSSEDKDYGNSKLNTYATLLMPFHDRNPAVQQIIQQMLASNDKKLKMNTALLMIRKKKPLPDTLLTYLASLDNFRYDLYSQLKKMKRLDLFPARYNNHIDLARSELMGLSSYNAPDTFVFLNKYPVDMKGLKGQIYFFRYKRKKDEGGWKIATIGIVPNDPYLYEYDLRDTADEYPDVYFSELTGTRIDEDEPLEPQLQKILKRKVYSKRKSAAEFYEDDRVTTAFPLFRD